MRVRFPVFNPTPDVPFSLSILLFPLQKVYLMEAGDMMYDFYTALFEKVSTIVGTFAAQRFLIVLRFQLRLHEPWQDASFLNITLQESLEFYLPEEKHHLFVDVAPEGTKAAALQPAAALQGLRIHYSVSHSASNSLLTAPTLSMIPFQVPWPVNMVIHSESVKVYSDVFAFLLQIKRVKFCMDNLSFSGRVPRLHGISVPVMLVRFYVVSFQIWVRVHQERMTPADPTPLGTGHAPSNRPSFTECKSSAWNSCISSIVSMSTLWQWWIFLSMLSDIIMNSWCSHCPLKTP